MDPQIIEEARKDVERAILKKKLKLWFDLIGFGCSSIAIGFALAGEATAWKHGLGAVGGYLMGTFAWRFISSFWDMIFTYIVAAQKGTIIALSLSKEGLDKWDCGDPSCEGCRERREKNA